MKPPGFLARLRSAWTIAKSFDSTVSAEAFLMGGDVDFDASRPEILRKPFNQHPTIYRCVRAISSSIGSLDLEVYEKGDKAKGRPPVEDHWLIDLFKTPNAMLRGRQLVEAVVAGLQLRGESFLWHREIFLSNEVKPRVRRPHVLIWLSPDKVEPDKQKGELVGWRWNEPGMGARVGIPLEEMTFHKLHDPSDPIRGIGPMHAALIEAGSEHRASLSKRAWWQNNSIPPVIFKPKTNWPETKRREFMSTWNSLLSGPLKRGFGAALPQEIDIEVLKLNDAVMEGLPGRKFSREQMLSAFGVPPFIAGILEPSPYSNTIEQKKGYWNNTILPLVRYVESVLSVDLLQRYEPEREVIFKVEPVLAEIMSDDFGKKVETAGKLWSLGWPAKEINERLELGLPTTGARLAHLREGFLPFSVVPAAQVMESLEEEEEEDDEEIPEGEETPPAPPPGEGDGDGGDTEGGGGEAPPPSEGEGQEGARPRSAALRRTHARAVQAGRIWSGLASSYADIGRGYHGRLKKWLNKIRDETLRNIEDAGGLKAIAKIVDIGASPDELLPDWEAVQIELRRVSESTWRRAMVRGANVLGAQAGIAISFDLLDPGVLSFLAEKKMLIKRVSDAVQERVRVAIGEGIVEGETINDLSRRVRSTFAFERRRSLTIARTETAQAFAGGRFQAMKQAGFTTHAWLSSRDPRVRESHSEGIGVDGEIVNVGEMFSNGVTFPAEPGGPPGETINCRCQTVPPEVLE